ncbi:DUF4900 domain-containing protein [Thermus scotoductus]|uniref:DUF4900 domain-containing protein n=1 Tax=Thermus scotoductus TaxID=37636 RepID=A0A430V2I6_THESC|nr:DUF4900 domain-containing protein [Thermus scotoductus]RTI17027.1 DUF4900 domain-containing protein [Thermus scotoductus]
MGRKGMALMVVLTTLILVSGIGTLLFLRTLNEMRHSQLDEKIVQTLMLARAGALVGGGFLSGPLRDQLDALVQGQASTTSCWALGGGDCSAQEPDPILTAQALNNLARALQDRVDQLTCNQDFSPEAGLSITLRVHFTDSACGQTLPTGIQLPPGRFVEGAPRSANQAATQTYALPFVLVAQGGAGIYRRNVVVQGEYRFTLGRSSFARYALFTHIHTLPNGTDIWFTDGTLFDGPVHTNTYFRFYRRPWFGGPVTSAGCTNPSQDGQACGSQRAGAYFYGRGFLSPTQMQPSPSAPVVTNRYGTHAPTFAGGIDWQASFIPLPQNAQDQKAAAQNGGLYFSQGVMSLKLSFQCENANGAKVACDTPQAIKYQYIEAQICQNRACNRVQREVYRYTEGGPLEKEQNNGRFQTVRPSFNGVIYVDGGVESLEGPGRNGNQPTPALASFAQITVAASGTIRIQGDLTYEIPPCTSPSRRNPDGTITPANCPNPQAQNILGIYSQDGDVLIGENAPDNVQIHATLMSSSGVVAVENYNRTRARGTAYLLGGIIEKYYGAFGTFNSTTGQQQTGYGRTFVYDPRLRRGLAPPFFPTTGKDQVLAVTLFAYGQREQLY